MDSAVVTFSVDERGSLKSPNLHDGFVDGVVLEGEKRVAVSLRDVSGQVFSMRLIEVEALVCNEFRQGNIILDITIFSGIAPDDDALGSLFGSPHPSVAREHHEQHKRLLQDRSDKIRKGVLKLVSIEPSYGCSLTALCGEVIISRTAR